MQSALYRLSKRVAVILSYGLFRVPDPRVMYVCESVLGNHLLKTANVF